MTLDVSSPARPPLWAALVFAAAVGGAAGLWPGPGAAATGPFEPFVGAWVGGGQIIGSNGVRERIRCRANEDESAQGAALSQSIVCASASFRLDIRSYAQASGRNVQGYWQEETRNVSGQLTGSLDDDRFVGAVTGAGFTARISLWSNGRRQAVSIRPSAGDIADVQIELERRG